MGERKLFGTDGIRGLANTYPMTPEVALRLGRAVTRVAGSRKIRGGPAHPGMGSERRDQPREPAIVVGKDTRLSGYMLETAFASGVCSMGGRVLLTGPLPTPAVAQLTHSMRADAGVVISASHNPYRDNGIKLFGPDGFKLDDAEELLVEKLLLNDEAQSDVVDAGRIGRAERIEEASGRYIVYAKNTFPSALALRGLRVVVDAANGAGYRVAPSVFHELGAKVYTTGCDPNGKNINDGVGALYPEHLSKLVCRHHADIGIGLDGDADRLIVVDEHGHTVDGDHLMAICARQLLKDKRLRKRTVISTVMSNMGLEHALQEAGGKLLRTQVGDRYVVEKMRSGGYSFGGEQSGHLVFLDHATTGDGIVAALQVLAVMVREGKPLSELSQVMTALPQVLKNVSLREKRPVESLPSLQRAIRAAEKKLGTRGRVLVRWSGTENKLRLMLEGPSNDVLDRLADDMAEAACVDLGPAQAP